MKISADCKTPGDYVITDFYTLGNPVDGSKNQTWFQFTDAETGIDTCCQKNSTSKSSTADNPDLNPRFPCDNAYVEFIYEPTGLTVIEAACPGR